MGVISCEFDRKIALLVPDPSILNSLVGEVSTCPSSKGLLSLIAYILPELTPLMVRILSLKF